MYRQALALSAGLGLFMATAWPQAASSALTPDQLVEAAIARNRDFLSLKQRIAGAQGLLKQARVGPVDTLEFNGLAGQPFGNAAEDSFSLSYSHTFETFGKRAKRVAVAEQAVALAQAEFDDRRRALSFEVKSRYADAVADQQKLAVLDRLLNVNREYLQLTEARVQKGDAAPLEADLLRVELNRDTAQRTLTEGRVRDAILQLKAAVDIPSTEAIVFSSSLKPPTVAFDLPHLKSLALSERPDLIALRIAGEQAARETKLAEVETKPNITLSGQYSHADTAFDQFGLTQAGSLVPIRDHIDSIGLGISIPLSRARRNRGNIEAAIARQSGAGLRRGYLESAIPTQVEAAYQRWRAAQSAADVFTKDVIDQSEKNLAVMRQAYNLGELRLLDILNEQRRLLDTELSYIDAQAELFRSYAELEEATGGSLQ
ncbi:MAG TPA: TolC family protein [Bryobacteraceae bacterium]|jgi:cobalt-zinc-cadmium efflux system outer membrane protein|nr:TolC family protein [Bryobacteraceae bacterium]